MVLTPSLEDRSSSLSSRDTVGPTPSIVILLIVDSIEQLTVSGPLLGSLLPHDNQGCPIRWPWFKPQLCCGPLSRTTWSHGLGCLSASPLSFGTRPCPHVNMNTPFLTVTCKHAPASFLPRTHVGMISGEGHSPYLRPPPPLVCFGVADPALARGLAQTHSSCVHVCTHVTWSPAVRTMAPGR